jgi:hypothetical protein
VTGIFTRLADRAAGRASPVRVRAPHPFERPGAGLRTAGRPPARPQVAGAVQRALTDLPPVAGRPATNAPTGPEPRTFQAIPPRVVPERRDNRTASMLPTPGKAASADPAVETATPQRAQMTRPERPKTAGPERAKTAGRERSQAPVTRRDPAEPHRPAEPPARPASSTPVTVVSQLARRTDRDDVEVPAALGTPADLTELVHQHLLSALSDRGLSGQGDLVLDAGPAGSDEVAAARLLAAVPPGTPAGSAIVGVGASRREPAPDRPPQHPRTPDVHVHVERVVVVRVPPAQPPRPAAPPIAPVGRRAPAVDHTAYLTRRREDR